jgi:hypothetical protein
MSNLLLVITLAILYIIVAFVISLLISEYRRKKQICKIIFEQNNKLLKKKKEDLKKRISVINNLICIEMDDNIIPKIKIYDNIISTFFLKFYNTDSKLEEMAYDISKLMGLSIIPTTIACDISDLPFDKKLRKKIIKSVKNHHQNVVIQEVESRLIPINGSNIGNVYFEEDIETKLDKINIQKSILFNIIIGKKASNKIDTIIDKNGNIYELNNCNIGNKFTDTWLLEAKKYEDIELDEDIKNELISSGGKLNIILDKYDFSIKKDIKDNYKKLVKILNSKKIIKIKDLRDFCVTKELV